MRRAYLRIAWLCAAFLAAAAPGFGCVQQFSGTYRLAPGGKLTIENINGTVRIEAGEGQQVQVQAIKTALNNPSDLDRVRIEVRSEGDDLGIYTRYPEGDSVEVAVDYTVRVPAHINLDHVQTVNGNVVLRGAQGSGQLRSVNGNVEVLDSSGAFDARTTNGNVRVELHSLSPAAPLALYTVNGSVVLGLPHQAQANLDASSMNGDFHSDLPVISPSSLNYRSFHGKLGSGGPAIVLRTVNGGIRIVEEKPST